MDVFSPSYSVCVCLSAIVCFLRDLHQPDYKTVCTALSFKSSTRRGQANALWSRLRSPSVAQLNMIRCKSRSPSFTLIGSIFSPLQKYSTFSALFDLIKRLELLITIKTYWSSRRLSNGKLNAFKDKGWTTAHWPNRKKIKKSCQGRGIAQASIIWRDAATWLVRLFFIYKRALFAPLYLFTLGAQFISDDSSSVRFFFFK